MQISIAVQRALQRKSDLEKELREIETFLSLYERYGGQAADPAASAEAVRHVASAPARSGVKTPSRKSKAARRSTNGSANGNGRKSFADNCFDLLVQKGHPMTGRELWTMFNQSGLKAGKRNDLNNFAVKLSQARSRFVNIKGVGYWPASVPCPAVGYDPTAEGGTPDGPVGSPIG